MYQYADEQKIPIRPHICPDYRCQVLFSLYDRRHFERGSTFSCFGRLAECQEITYKGTNSLNTHCLCIYTPFGGLTRSFVSSGDAFSYMIGLNSIIKDCRKPLRCDNCGQTNDIITGLRVVEYDEDSALCDKCAVMEGVIEFEQKDRRWKLNKKRRTENLDDKY